MTRYRGLTRWLAETKPTEVILTFEEIEQEIGFLLPKSAQLPQFWENPSNRMHISGVKRAVREAGFQSFLLEGQGKVRFIRY
ncbi:hypothetical protein KX729_29280 [Rhizobium sp. XQZ8]|uniref:DUF7662 domain-containing protein n=1 Tax=Rhizobium populisoli TaxID=2859785 RepID=UPI001CA48869|nr:hypothetical protein [Rhizobium populisoli]MBW6425510.1 hypothetical protein [Rhizobium populisoli]